MSTVRELIAQVRDETGEIDPRRIAERVRELIDDPWAALDEVLLPYVVNHRNDRPAGQDSPAEASAILDAPDGQADAAEASAIPRVPVGRSCASPKWRKAKTIFDTIEYVDGTYKPLRDLTLLDIDWLVGDKEKRAGELHDAAKRYARLREAVARHNAKRVRDLPENLVESILR